MKKMHSGPAVKQILPDTRGKNFLTRIWIWLTVPVKWQTTELDYIFVESLGLWVLIPYFLFDGASVPKLLHFLVRPEGFLFIPGLYHDFAFKFAFLWVSKNKHGPYRKEKVDQKLSDQLFKNIGLQLTGMFIVKVAWLFLRLFGFVAWNKHRKKEKQQGASAMNKQNIYFLIVDEKKCLGCGTCQNHLDLIKEQELPTVDHSGEDRLLLDDYGGKIQISSYFYQEYEQNIQDIVADCPNLAIALTTRPGTMAAVK